MHMHLKEKHVIISYAVKYAEQNYACTLSEH